MDFKKKFKTFISEIKESTGKSPSEENIPTFSQLVESPAVTKFKEHLNDYQCDPQAEREIVDSIQPAYFNDESFDTSEFELNKLPDKLELQQIDQDRTQLRKQLQAVSKKISELVLENHPAYAAELQRVMEMQDNLQTAGVICANGRRQLAKASTGFTTASLGLLANYKKRQQLIGLLKSVKTIKTLQRTDIRLREMVEEEDYPGAIQLCLECQKAASTFKHYTCISELSSKLQDTLEMIEESLDVALSKTCNSFDETHYEKVQKAYRLLGKTQTAMDQLHMHFTSAIHNTAFTIVLGYVELCSGTGDSRNQKRQYADLCKNTSTEMFTPCLIDLCKALWEVMKSYHKTIQWHEAHDQDGSTEQAEGGGGGTSGNMEALLNKRYIKQKLEHGLGRIWGDVQQKVKTYLISTDLSYFKYDDFIKVLDLVNRLIQIGEEFCGSKSEGLQDSIRKQSLNYFRNYHRARMDELRMFLENEGWELCPVKSSFSILHLQEFKFLRSEIEAAKQLEPDIPSPEHTPKNFGYFTKYGEMGSPFEVQAEEEEHEDVLETNGYSEDTSNMQRTFSQDSDSDDDIPEELKQDYVDEQTGEGPVTRTSPLKRKRSLKASQKQPPIITNTTLNVCRLFGKYMQMMNVLKPIAFDVTIFLSQLFDYYLYAIYSFFAVDAEMNELNERSLSPKLRTTLKRIRDNLIIDGEATGQDQADENKVAHPHLSPIVNLTAPNTLYGLPERVVATESLVFLSEQFQFLQLHLEALIPSAKKAFLQQFYSQTVSTAQELRKPVYRTVAAKSIDYEMLLHLMSQVKFDIKDIMSQHSQYVDVVLQQFTVFSDHLIEINRRIPIPTPVSYVIWEHCIRLANRTIVEGYADTKKCTNEGRALMQLDFQQFLMKLERLTDLRPIPDKEFVEAYVKAFYLPEQVLETWIRDHKEYTSKQLISLINCVGHINKKGRQKLISVVEEIDKTRR